MPVLIIIFTLAIAAFLLFYLYMPTSELSVESEKGKVSIEKSLLKNYFNAYFLQKFPGRQVKTKITFKDKQVFVSLVLPPCPIERQSKTLFQVTSDLYMLFYHLLGSEFDLQVTNRFSRNEMPIYKAFTKHLPS